MRKGLVAAIAAVAVLGGGYAWLSLAHPFAAGSPKAGGAAAAEADGEGARTLVAAESARVTRLSVKRGDGSAYAFVRRGEGFALEGRPAVELDAAKVATAFSSACALAASRIVDANPARSGDFGFDRPAMMSLALADGTRFGVEIGSRSPGGDGYYVRLPGEKAIYAASTWAIEAFFGAPGDFRVRDLPAVDTRKLSYLKIIRSDTAIEIESRPSPDDLDYMTSLKILKPFRRVYAASGDGFAALTKAMPPRFSIRDFADADPGGAAKPLAAYGLDPPALDITIRDGASGLRLLAGKAAADGALYAKLADKPGVFTLAASDLAFATAADPFKLVNRLPLLVMIDRVDRLSFRLKDRTIVGEIRRNAPPSYAVDGKGIDEAAFKKIYQLIIGISIEGAAPGRVDARGQQGEAYVDFRQNGGRPGLVFDFVPFNDDFYALSYGGEAEFLVSKSQVRAAMASVQAAMAAANR